MQNKIFLVLTLITNFVFCQEEQAGIELAASFPAFAEGNVKPDLPANGYYWDKDHSGWGIGIEIQSRPSEASDYFMFATGYFYDDEGKQFWCAISEPFIFNEDVNHWRDQKEFSNLPFGHDELPVLAEMDVKCNKMEGGSSLDSTNHQSPSIDRVVNLNFLWRNPSELEITTENGNTLYTSRFAWHDDLRNPSIDWVLDYVWSISSSVVSYDNDNNEDEESSKISFDYNMKTNFEKLDVSDQRRLREFVGHQEHYVYYISTLKTSIKRATYFNFDNSLVNMFEPYINGGFSNFYWAVLIHDPIKNNLSLFTVGGEKVPEALLPNSGIGIKFRANINPDADIIDFYPLFCEGVDLDCPRTMRTYRNTNMADFSPQNIHRSTMKMFKIKTGGEAFLYQPNNGEADSQSMIRIKQMLIEAGLILEN